MNAKTKDALQKFVTTIEDTVPQLVHLIGLEAAKDIIARGEILRHELDHDETIIR